MFIKLTSAGIEYAVNVDNIDAIIPDAEIDGLVNIEMGDRTYFARESLDEILSLIEQEADRLREKQSKMLMQNDELDRRWADIIKEVFPTEENVAMTAERDAATDGKYSELMRMTRDDGDEVLR